MHSIPIGLSGSDFIADRGHIDPSVYGRVDYLEYGGHFPARFDPGVNYFLQSHPSKRLGRHLVSTELPAEIDLPGEVEFIKNDVAKVPVDYLVTDFCFWRLGGRSLDNLWFRPLNLTEETAVRIARNAQNIESEIGVPFFLENPPFVCVAPGLDLARFLRVLADHGAKLCLDVGHFLGWCFNSGADLKQQLSGLPTEAIGMCHVAGLSHVCYAGSELLIDNHNVPPPASVIDLLGALVSGGAPIERITYESELAPTNVQFAGLKKLGR